MDFVGASRPKGIDMATEHERAYYDALKLIARDYQTPAQLRRHSEKDYGLSYEEALEMAYENIQSLAQAVIHGRRRPRSQPHE